MRKKVFLVNWMDSNGSPGWKHSDELNLSLAMCQTIGFLVTETKNSITLALNRTLTEGCAPYGDLITIPKVSIKNKIQISIKE